MSKIMERKNPSKMAKMNIATETAAMRAVPTKILSKSRFTISSSYPLILLSFKVNI
jgi:hypothetical protein